MGRWFNFSPVRLLCLCVISCVYLIWTAGYSFVKTYGMSFTTYNNFFSRCKNCEERRYNLRCVVINFSSRFAKNSCEEWVIWWESRFDLNVVEWLLNFVVFRVFVCLWNLWYFIEWLKIIWRCPTHSNFKRNDYRASEISSRYLWTILKLF